MSEVTAMTSWGLSSSVLEKMPKMFREQWENDLFFFFLIALMSFNQKFGLTEYSDVQKEISLWLSSFIAEASKENNWIDFLSS